MESASRERKKGAGARSDDKELLLHSRDDEEDDDDDDDDGRRQPYKCTFCRRGFPTAQALGGHMNIHRKHRGTSSSSAATTMMHAVGRTSLDYDEQQHSSLVTTSCSPRSSSTATGHAADERVAAEPTKELRLFLEADPAAGRRGNKGAGDDEQQDRYLYSKDDQGEEELDLELRLGGGAGSSSS